MAEAFQQPCWASPLAIDVHGGPANGKNYAMSAQQRLITYESLKAKGISLGKTQLWRLERRGQFPARVTVSPGRHAWVESEIDSYLSLKIAERDERLAVAPKATADRGQSDSNQLELPL